MLTADDIQVVPRCACYLLWATFQTRPPHKRIVCFAYEWIGLNELHQTFGSEALKLL